MPYKDLKKRRDYHREYQQRRRAKKGLVNPCQTRITKGYVCFHAPHLRLPGIAFKNGLFVTDKPDEQTKIEQDSMYGSNIFSWILEP